MSELGRFLIIAGLLITGFGLLLTFAGKIPWLGRLPGDIFIRKENFTFYFPLATCIIVSLVITLILWLIRK